MKKFTGRYTAETGKTLKGSERLFCRVTEDGDIYISNGFVLYKMNPLEYAATVQPVTCCDAGNWEMNQYGKHDTDKNSFDLVKYFTDAANKTAEAAPLERCPLTLQADKTPAACFYSPAAKFAAIYNAKFIAAVTGSATFRAAGPLSGAVAYTGDEPFAVILPIKPKDEATRAIKAYFAAPVDDSADTKALRHEADKLRAEVEQLRAELAEAQTENEHITAALAEALRATAANETQQPREDAPQQAEPRTAAELIAARFTEFDGVTATIKGAQTAAPVVWLSGNTQHHADKIEAAGAKWSNKKSAYYVRVA